MSLSELTAAESHPQDLVEQRAAARHLVVHPLTCAEHDPEVFRLIRRHEADLDRSFTQRFGYRLHVDADTARLYKTSSVPWRRPLRTSTGRAFTTREYVCLSLVLACTTAGPNVVSLRDLVDGVRSAAAEADVVLDQGSVGRRQLVTVLRWMVDQGLLGELHERVDAYAEDLEADAILAVRADRIALLPLPALTDASTAAELLQGAQRRSSRRVWLRSRLLEDPVLYRNDLEDADWRELRRRLGEDRTLFAELFGLHLEARAEGIAAIDPTGSIADEPFPSTGTVGHAALLLIDVLARHEPAGEVESDSESDDTPEADRGWIGADTLRATVDDMVARYRTRWSKDLVEHPERLTRTLLALLERMRLVEVRHAQMRVLPAAHRFRVAARNDSADGAGGGSTADDGDEQASLW